MEFRCMTEVGCMLVCLFICVSAEKRLSTNVFHSFGKRINMLSPNINGVPYQSANYRLEPDYSLPAEESDDTLLDDLRDFIRNQPAYARYRNAKRRELATDELDEFSPWYKLLSRAHYDSPRRSADGQIYR